MKIAFLDSSILLRIILGEPNPYLHLEKIKNLYTSELLRIEVLRTIDRLRILNTWTPEEVAIRIRLFTALSAAIEFIPVQPPILRRATEPFPTIVGTLDAIHIATALLTQDQLKKPLLFLTHDSKQGVAAQAAGLNAEGFAL